MSLYLRDSFRHRRQFASLEEADRQAPRWCLEVAGTRIHGTTRQRPLELFQREEQPCLLSLPLEPSELAVWQRAKVAQDSHPSAARALYSVPYRYMDRGTPPHHFGKGKDGISIIPCSGVLLKVISGEHGTTISVILGTTSRFDAI